MNPLDLTFQYLDLPPQDQHLRLKLCLLVPAGRDDVKQQTDQRVEHRGGHGEDGTNRRLLVPNSAWLGLGLNSTGFTHRTPRARLASDAGTAQAGGSGRQDPPTPPPRTEPARSATSAGSRPSRGLLP